MIDSSRFLAPLFLGFLIVWPTGGFTADDFRTFTAADGRRIEARVVSVTGDTATISRADGREYTVPINVFSEADRTFLRRWKPGAAAGGGSPGENWPQFRGPDGNGIAPESSKLPLKWSVDENLIWRTALPGRGSSSPIVWGDHIFLTAYSGYGESEANPGDKADLKRHLLCLDKGSGEILWDETVPSTRNEQNYAGFLLHHGYASHTPATDGESIYVYFAKSGALAFDFSGKKRWHFEEVGNGTGGGFGSGGGVLLFEDLVIVNSSPESEAIIALERSSGKEVWRKTGIVQCFHTPVLLGGELLIDSRDQLLGLDPRTGEEKWKGAGPPAYVCNSPTVVDGVAFITHGYPGPTVAIKPGGETLWSKRIATTVPSPAIANGRLFTPKEDILTCLDAVTGEEVFRERMGVTVTRDIYASPLVAGDRVYVVTRRDGTLVFAAGDKFELLAHNVIAGDDSLWNATPAVSGNRLFLRSEKALYCVGE